MRGLKTLLGAAALLMGLAMMPVTPVAEAQVVINIGVPPSCPWGYYDYAPYRCAPRGYYGPGYFYNGIFLGVGPWAGWGYAHGWGHHRFVAPGGGRYHGNAGYQANHGRWAGHPAQRGESHEAHGAHPQERGGHPAGSHGASPHGGAHDSHGSSPHGDQKPH